MEEYKSNTWNKKRKHSDEDAQIYFSKQNEQGNIDQMPYSLVKQKSLLQKIFTNIPKDTLSRKKKTSNQQRFRESDRLPHKHGMKRTLIFVSQSIFIHNNACQSQLKELQNLKRKVSDQIGIQEMLLNRQFGREAQPFIDVHVHSAGLKKIKSLENPQKQLI